ncbi:MULTISPECIES: class I SAM-dependent RNA methyltransferase [Corynebacterium]|uniref:class I SAM-dependent RNA methyltransferase n=1 Tax=Corynebacterium TaxID=1716 RepID=UPI00264E9666|nr:MULTISPECIES: TRAM domain-containing protein [Corynebacterium]MDN8623551.1 TRAM domain-containing protein [Corynebacterium kroppenstedtii]
MTHTENHPRSGVPSHVTVDITDFAYGGQGIGRVDNHVVFVDGAVAGDRDVTVDIDAERSSASLWRGGARTIGHRSSLRRNATISCPAAENGAGCCDFLEITPDKSAEVKASITADQMRRIGHFDVEPTCETLPPYRGWRTRMRLAVDHEGRAGLRVKSGHRIVTNAVCSQAAPGLMDGLDTLRFTPGAEVILALDSNDIRHIVEVDAGAPSKQRSGTSTTRSRTSRRGRRGRSTILEGGNYCVERISDNAALTPSELSNNLVENSGGAQGSAQSTEGRTFILPPTAFWQAHRGAPTRYRELVRELLPEVHGGVAWDLYGGIGLFADILAEKTRGPVDSVEIDKNACTWGRRSLNTLADPSFSPSSIRFLTSRVDRAWSSLRRNNKGGVDLVVLDPPRKGAGTKVIGQIAAAHPQVVVHIACDPATGARDYAAWLDHGYEMSSMRVIDAFPGTHHMEIITVFTERS